MRYRAGIVIVSLCALCGAQTVTPGEVKERTNMRDERYCEVLVVTGNLLKAKAAVYNTIGLNDCPAAQWERLDAKQLKAELKAASVVLNGPRHFMMDRNAISTAPRTPATFGGIQMRLLAYVEVNPMMQKRTPYTENGVDRQTAYTYVAGKNIYQLVAPGGKRYIMQIYSQEVDKNLREAGLSQLGSKLKLPAGWKFEVIQLDKDLAVRNSGTKAYVLQDDLRNSYQKMM
jgi:hypothetical protein